MTIDKNFKMRVEDINEIFTMLSFVLKIESHKNKPLLNDDTKEELYVTQEMQCVLKAQFLLVLYNLVESTVNDCLNALYDAIFDDGLTYFSLSDDMRKMWRSHMKRRNHPNFEKSDDEIMSMNIRFEELAVNISGSLDIRKIFEVFQKHGCPIDDKYRDEFSNSFLIVKNRRNLLAHGNISFSQCGACYMLADLEKFKNHIITFMQMVTITMKQHISDHKYKRY